MISILTTDDLNDFLRLHGARQWKMFFTGLSHLTVLLNMHIHSLGTTKFMQYTLDQIRPTGILIELVEVEEFLKTPRIHNGD